MLRGMRSAAKYIWIIVFIAFVGGFLLLDTSGLLGSNALTTGTTVAKVNGTDILFGDWSARLQAATKEASDQSGRGLTLDESRDIENRVLDQMIIEILLNEEYKRRGISVTDDEILRSVEISPHPSLLQDPDLQTDGRFDRDKYLRFLQSPSTRAAGWLVMLENYYRTEIPRRKLLEQIISDVHITDTEMWNKWREAYDSVQISFVAFTPDMHADSIPVSDAEIRRYYDAHQEELKEGGRAMVSLLHLPRLVTAADTASARARAAQLRAEIVAGDDSAFSQIARRESDDTRTSADGGMLRTGIRGQFFGPAFDSVAFALKPKQVSAPVLSPFGLHIVQLLDRKGDSASFRHVLVEIRQADSVAVAMDRRADSLASIGSAKTDPKQFDEAARLLGLKASTALVFSGRPLVSDGRYVPSVSAWAFSGARVGETSDLFDGDDGFWLARIDTLVPEGVPPLDHLREIIRKRIEAQKKIEALRPRAEKLGQRAVATTLEAAAKELGANVQKSPVFARVSFVNGIGQDNQAIGAAFALATGAVSTPVVTEDAVFVMRVDRRVNADHEAWEKQRGAQRILLMQSLQQQRIQTFLQGLRENAKIVDERQKIAEIGREATPPPR